MRDRLVSLWWTLKYAWALWKFHRQCVAALALDEREVKEFICKAKFNARELPPELSEIVFRELGWLEWSIQ